MKIYSAYNIMSNIVSLCVVNIKDIKKNECQVFIQFKNNCSI